ncbi:MAG: pyridoxamine 5'-phosphate oxidase family protein [Pseudonocardia sp.]|nr:pyridoxamine 5'-phosphate oxidase family protein [Pseudonocardia sp.]
MSSWNDFESAEPEFAALVRRVLDHSVGKVLATLRADGAPRVSGIEIEFADGELTFGSMPGARKGADLLRDPRFALHSAPAEQAGDPPGMGDGDVKLAGRAVATGPLDGPVTGDAFRADLREVVWTGLNDARDRLVIRWWRPGQGMRRVERE